MATTKAPGPITLQPGDRMAIVAGSGRLPVHVAESLAARGTPPFVVMMAGEADQDLSSYDHTTLALEAIAELGGVLRRAGATHVVFAGGISRRPKVSAMRPSLSLLRFLPRVLAGLARGDDGALRTLAATLEAQGFKVVGAHRIAPDLLAAEGPMTAARPGRSDWRDLDAAAEAARAIGALDIGQAAVASGVRAIALEGIEGTDGLLERVRQMRSHGRLAGKAGGALVKCAKPSQELRMDLPSIGPATVAAVHAAGLAGIGVEADRSLVLESASVIAEADRLGVFIVGLPAKGGA